MTSDEIKKAWKCCTAKGDCADCPLSGKEGCTDTLSVETLAYINRLEAENSKHIKAIDELAEINIRHEEAVRKAKQDCLLCHKRQKERIKELEAEVERLKTGMKNLVDKQRLYKANVQATREYQIEQAKSEAIKEFGKLLIDNCQNGEISACDILDYVVEMVGESNDT